VSLTRELAARIARASHGTLERMESIVTRDYPALDTRRLAISIRSVYDGRHQLLRYSDGRVELYDVSTDPAQEHDLSATAPDLVERLTQLCDPF
jgi:hypothetical protein